VVLRSARAYGLRRYPRAVVAELLTAALICLDPGHGTAPAIGAQREPIGPGSHILKEKDGGGAPGEAEVALAIARRLATILQAHGFRVALTRTGPVFELREGGNIARAEFCNARHAALMLRIHADGSTDRTRHGISTLYPAFHRGWTDDVYARSLRAARVVQAAVVAATGAADLGMTSRADLTGFNWSDVPVILVETGFLSNPPEAARLRSAAYEVRVARGLAAGITAFVG
jgi:N-acetylmuramoyl-L-alanine amidase